MKGYENKTLSGPGENLDIRDKCHLSRGKCANGDQIAQSVERRNGYPRVLVSNHSTSVYFLHPATHGKAKGAATEDVYCNTNMTTRKYNT